MSDVADLEVALKRAETFAQCMHLGQLDKQGEPYIGHVSRVARSVMGWDRVVAWLHDVVEDTNTTPAALLTLGMPVSVVDSVLALTRREGETYAAYIERIKASDERAVRVKIADLRDNLRLGAESLRPRYERALKTLTAHCASET